MKRTGDNKLKVLHITPWYPHPENPLEAMWIKRHVESIAPFVDQYVFHVRVSAGPSLRYHRCRTPGGEQITLIVPTKRWFVFELAWFFILFRMLIVGKAAKDFDVLQFHISYPALTYWHWLKHFIHQPVFIIEHWSAYHYNFGVKDGRKLGRVRRIFSHGIPVACVSRSLLDDLIEFSGGREFRFYLLPNVVENETFFYDASGGDGSTELLMVSQWKWPKMPGMTLEAFARWNKQHAGKYTLKIGGYGDQMDAIGENVRRLGLQAHVRLLGAMTSRQVADEMRRSLAFVHCSGYETFSVVCAEALCCGTPVVASKVGGIPELLDDSNGILVPVNTVEAWIDALNALLTAGFDRPLIASKAREKFSASHVGDVYYSLLTEIAHGAEA